MTEKINLFNHRKSVKNLYSIGTILFRDLWNDNLFFFILVIFSSIRVVCRNYRCFQNVILLSLHPHNIKILWHLSCIRKNDDINVAVFCCIYCFCCSSCYCCLCRSRVSVVCIVYRRGFRKTYSCTAISTTNEWNACMITQMIKTDES